MGEPARSIYDAFQVEAAKRDRRTLEEWLVAEREAVFRESVQLAKLYSLRPPTIEEVRIAENHACGSVDYGAKWAYGVVEFMHSDSVASVKPLV